jgi:hypothetical protein
MRTEIRALMSNIEQNNSDGPTVIRQGVGGHQRFPVLKPKFAAIAANDNSCEWCWPLVPFPEGNLGISGAQQDSKLRLSTQSASFLNEEVITTETVQPTFHSSWRERFGRMAYVVVVSIATFGWLYLLWLAVLGSVQAILN